MSDVVLHVARVAVGVWLHVRVRRKSEGPAVTFWLLPLLLAALATPLREHHEVNYDVVQRTRRQVDEPLHQKVEARPLAENDREPHVVQTTEVDLLPQFQPR